MLKLVVFCVIAVGGATAGWAQAQVHVKMPDLSGTSTLKEQTASAAIQNYLQAWDGLRSAMAQNRADLLDSYFIGTARDKLSATVRQQASLGIRTNYQDKSHDIQVVFYSRDGMSLQLIDDVEYVVQLVAPGQHAVAQNVKARYVAVMTPTETKWRVRVFQAVPE